eukprot:scaffold14809_cov54-Phaeocystis_antarctica.AAC.1
MLSLRAASSPRLGFGIRSNRLSTLWAGDGVAYSRQQAEALGTNLMRTAAHFTVACVAVVTA